MRFLGVVLVVLGILAIIAGVIYFVEPAKSLPTLLPGHVLHSTGHRTKRGIAALAVGVVLFLLGMLSWMRAPRRAYG